MAGAAFAALGLRDAALGVAWPSVRETFDQPLAALGTVLIAGTIGALLGSLASGRLHQRFGPRVTLAGLTAVAVVAMALVTAGPDVGRPSSPAWRSSGSPPAARMPA